MPFRPANLVHTDEGSLAESMPSGAENGSPEPWTRSSAVEHALHTGGVAGSIPAASTTPGLERDFAGITRRRPATLVYFIAAPLAQMIKIGSSRDAYLRLEQLQTGSPEKLHVIGTITDPSAMILERVLHEQFAHLRSHGEWFCEAPELAAYIAANMDPPTPDADLYPDLEPVPFEEATRWSPRPKIPQGVTPPKGNSRAARMARYKLARGIQ